MNKPVYIICVGIAIVWTLGFAFLLGQARNGVHKNHQLVCLVDRLFGLDRPLTRKQLKALRPGQVVALGQIIQSCPELRGGAR